MSKYLVDLTNDMDEIKSLGTKRQDGARRKRRNAGTTWLDGHKRDIGGVKGKFAVYKGIGEEPELIRRTSDGDPDNLYGGVWKGWTWQSRWTEYSNGNLLYSEEHHSLKTRCGTPIEIFLLVVPYRGENIVRIAGWIWVEEYVRIWKPCWFNPEDMCVGQDKLSPFETFINIDPKYPLREDIISEELGIQDKCTTTDDLMKRMLENANS